MCSTAKVSSRTRSRTKSVAMVPFLQDAQNLDLIGLVLQQLLDSTKGHAFFLADAMQVEYTDVAGVIQKLTHRRRAGGIFADLLDNNMCVHAVIQALSSVCRLWDEVRALPLLAITRAPLLAITRAPLPLHAIHAPSSLTSSAALSLSTSPTP